MKKDVPKMHKLPLKESQIYLIDTTSDFLKFTNEIANGVKIVGLDAEWKPCFGFNKCDLSLFQVATHDCVYILDFAALGAVAPETLWKRFCNVLLGNPNIIKLGFGIDGDLTVMRATLSKFHHDIKVTDASFLDLGVLWKILVNDHNFVFPYPAASSSTSPVGLNTFIELCLGEKLDKSDQFSNWEKRPLRQSQIIYAGKI